MENEYQKFANEVFQKLDSIVRYNNLQTLKEDKSFKALWFRKHNLLWNVVKVQHVENEIMCFDAEDHLKNIIFVGDELPSDLDKETLKVFDASDIEVVLIPMNYNYEKMVEKLHNEKIRMWIIFEYQDDVFDHNTYVQFPKVEKRGLNAWGGNPSI